MSGATFLINEVYPCLQGEGANLGRPSVLVRFQICNLRCTWCDTPYTHTYKSDPRDPARPELGQAFERLSLEVLCERIAAHAPVRHLILSGGEPTLQNLAALMRALGPSYTAEVESNGTRIPHAQIAGFAFEDYARFQWNISPKGLAAGQRLEHDALAHWAHLARSQESVFFKFVVRAGHAEADLAEVLALCDRHSFLRERVFLMAEGTSTESQSGNIWLHDACLAHGFRYAPRLHVLMFGPRRGV